MPCSKCGHVIDDESLDYCGECGEPLNVQADEDERTEVSEVRYVAEDEENTGTDDENPDGAAPDYEERARPAPADSWGDR
ncbi:MAG TPA: zinc ribbon domain-containing protein, partial [Cystobacter sp.]